MYDRYVEEVSNRKVEAIENFNAEILKHKKLVQYALQSLPEDKETTQLKEKLDEVKEIPLDSSLNDLSSIHGNLIDFFHLKSNVVRIIDTNIPQLKLELENAVKTARTEIKEFDAQCLSNDAKVKFSIAEIAKKIKESLLEQIATAEPDIQKRIQNQLMHLNNVFSAFSAFESMNQTQSKLADNSLLKGYYESLQKSQKFMSFNELRKMETEGAHYARELLDRIKFNDDLEKELNLIDVRQTFLNSSQCAQQCPESNKADFNIALVFANDKLLLANTFLKKDIKKILDVNFVENEAKFYNAKLKPNYCDERDQIALKKIKEANQYFKEAASLAGIAVIKPLANNHARNVNDSEIEAKKPNATHALCLKKLRNKPPVSKLGLAVANATQPPMILNPRSVQHDAENLKKIAEGGPVSLNKMLSEAPEAPMPARVLTVSPRPRLVLQDPKQVQETPAAIKIRK